MDRLLGGLLRSKKASAPPAGEKPSSKQQLEADWRYLNIIFFQETFRPDTVHVDKTEWPNKLAHMAQLLRDDPEVQEDVRLLFNSFLVLIPCSFSEG